MILTTFQKKILAVLAFIVLLFAALHFTHKPYSKNANIPDSITHHVLKMHGKKYAYTSRAGTITLYNKAHKPTVSMFYTSETLNNPKEQNRPITFFFNGGPGASSMLLRIASFGPKRIILDSRRPGPLAPYHLVDNEYSLLDKTDMVFIDMPGAGFSHLLGKSKPADFFGVDNDVNAFAEFIVQYIHHFHRQNSPKFLFGESYGTTRAAILVNHLQTRQIMVNGVVLQSPVLNYSTLRPEGSDFYYALSLPSLAATAWHFHRSSYHPAELKTLLDEVEQFALNDYLHALIQGSTLSQQESDAIAQKLHQYLGFSTQTLKRHYLRISNHQFFTLLLAKQSKKLGQYDTRLTLDIPTTETALLPSDADLSGLTNRAAVVAMNSQYIRENLDYQSSEDYRTRAGEYYNWNFKHEHQLLVNATFDLTNAMLMNPHLRIFSADGYYDLSTPYFANIYTLRNLYLPSALKQNIDYHFYSAGHMIYLDPDAVQHYRNDLGNWYDNKNEYTKSH